MNALSTILAVDSLITTQELFKLVNECRQQCGEKPLIWQNLVRTVKTELAGELKSIKTDFNDKNNNLGGFGRGRKTINNWEHSLTQAMRVLLKESKAVRKAVVEKLESQHNELIAIRAMELLEQKATDVLVLAQTGQAHQAADMYSITYREIKKTGSLHGRELAKLKKVNRLLKEGKKEITKLIQPDLFD
ncbi:hypothetical protein [Escherichia coli]|uniref:hypothetical protein n=1 Tax=Escherichia coli TaxID=562 RepID=UPI0015D4B85A|nr:hypothetical protein [Escherichia coli]EER7558093.1 hypothetical protein [Escherichia coli]EJD4214366.1 hypothetical protein [Escherichia coli]EKV5484751.1 hypothetical protein [Escherichia coli]HBB7045235.1 hypothetical protein [Escherichia coli]HDV2374298.1 hypothetical protein [Escherichia coli]